MAGVPAQDLHEVGRVREAGATADLRCRHTIEERGLKHAHSQIDAGSDQHGSKGFATRRQRSMQGSRGDAERGRDISRVQRGIRTALSDVVMHLVTHRALDWRRYDATPAEFTRGQGQERPEVIDQYRLRQRGVHDVFCQIMLAIRADRVSSALRATAFRGRNGAPRALVTNGQFRGPR